MVPTANGSSFLTEDYIKSTCKPGTVEACRFFSISGSGFGCEKFGSLMEMINKRVETNQMRATGDNCNGLLGVIMGQKSNFLGKKVLYEECLPISRVEGVIKDLTIDESKKSFTIHIDAGEESFPFEISLRDLRIADTRDYYGFAVSNAGSIAGAAKIFK